MTDTGNRSFAASVVVQSGRLGQKPWIGKLRRCVVDENVGLPSTAVLVYEDGDRELLAGAKATIGSKLKVFVVAAQTNARKLLFTGEITALEMDVDGTGAFTVIRATSRAHRLLRGTRVRAFRQMPASAVVREVVKGAGLTVGRVETLPITYQHLSQPAVSDWDFLQILAQEHGAVVTMDDRERLEFTRLKPAASAPGPTATAKTSPFVLEFGRNLMALRAALTSGELANGVEVRSWDAERKQKLVARRSNAASKTVRPGLAAHTATKAFRTKTRTVVVDTPYATQAEANAAARALEASISAGFGELEAVVEGNVELRAGVPIALTAVSKEFAGRYTATGVTHVLEPDAGYRTTVVVSASYDRSLAGLANGAAAPARVGRMPGLATGIVTDIKETGKHQRGWVKLKFPWLDDTYVTDWVRTVQFGGSRGGGVLSPEVNDEVLVGFEQGSLDRPYVLGGLYNGVDKPSQHDVALVDGRSGRVNRRSLVSPDGNRLELLDDNRTSGVRLTTGNERLEVLLDANTNSLELNVFGMGGRRATSSIVLDSMGITLNARNGVVRVKGRLVELN